MTEPRMMPVTFVYAAIGQVCICHACISARSVKAVMPAARTVLWADQQVRCASLDESRPLLLDPSMQPEIRRIRIHKLEGILQAAESLRGDVVYLDADTFVTESILPALSRLEREDIAVAHDTWRQDDYFPWTTPFNCGVILFRAGPRIAAFFRRWRDRYREQSADRTDRVSFRALLTESGLRIGVLPPEMNARCGEPVHLSGRVKIVHVHDSPDPLRNPAVLAHLLNQRQDNRVFIPAERRLFFMDKSFGTGEMHFSMTEEVLRIAREAWQIDYEAKPWAAAVRPCGACARSPEPRKAVPDSRDLSLDVIELQGVRIDLTGLDDSMKCEIVEGRYETAEASICRKLIETGESILELGGGIGFVGILCRGELGATRVVSLEPNPATLGRLRRNYALNNLEPTVIEAAVAAEDGIANLHLSSKFWLDSLIRSDGSTEPRAVRTVSFPSLLREAGTEFTALIVDVEGAETLLPWDTLPSRIRKVIVEIHPDIGGVAAAYRVLHRLMLNGFEVVQTCYQVFGLVRAANTTHSRPESHSMGCSAVKIGRGRDAGLPRAPSQIPASGTTAPGSYLEYLASKRA